MSLHLILAIISLTISTLAWLSYWAAPRVQRWREARDSEALIAAAEDQLRADLRAAYFARESRLIATELPLGHALRILRSTAHELGGDADGAEFWRIAARAAS